MNNSNLRGNYRPIYAIIGFIVIFAAGVYGYASLDFAEPVKYSQAPAASLPKAEADASESMTQAEFEIYASGMGINPADAALAPFLKVVLPAKIKDTEQAHPYGPGIEHEFLEFFLSRNQARVLRVYADSYDEAMQLLDGGTVDLMVGFGADAAFKSKTISKSPPLVEFYPVMVVLPDEELKGLDLDGVHFNKISYSEAQLAALEEHEGQAVLLDPAAYALIMPVHDGLKTYGRLGKKTAYYWFWKSDNSLVDSMMRSFWADKPVSKMLAVLQERYYGFLPDKPRHAELRDIARVITETFGTYNDSILKASAETGIDPLLLAAVIFQESRFDPEARSFTGVRGIMQLTTATAQMLGVNRLEPDEAIMGGARYLRSIYDSLDAPGMSEFDKWCLTLAGFNQGPAIARRGLKMAVAAGRDPSWVSVRSFYPSMVENGFAYEGFRPYEAISYVESVRYYYYVFSGLARLTWPEHQNLAALLASR